MRKSIKYFVLVIVNSLFLSCSNYNTVFSASSEDIISRKAKVLEYVLKKDELFLIFTRVFDNTQVKVIENNKMVYDGLMNTDESGKSNVFKININSELTIFFDKIKKPLKITKEQMKLYKYIYISKNKNKITAEFSNGAKDLGAMPDNQ